jgi:hypothetical protein
MGLVFAMINRSRTRTYGARRRRNPEPKVPER